MNQTTFGRDAAFVEAALLVEAGYLPKLDGLVVAWCRPEQQLQRLQDHHASLAKLAAHYKDPFVIENEARQQLGYIRPGEHPVIITSSDSQGQPATTHPVKLPVQQGYWQEWWNAFFGNN